MKGLYICGILVVLASLLGGGWVVIGTAKAQEDDTALCPDPLEISPCLCTNYSLSNMEMDCSAVQDEYELAEAFTAYFPVTDFNKLTISHNPWLRELRDDALGNVTFRRFFISNGALEIVEDNALEASYSTAASLQFLHNNISTFPFDALPLFTELTLLDLSYNNIDEFPVLSSSSLETIHLNNNPLDVLPGTAFQDTPLLSIIYLQETALQNIPSGMMCVRVKLRQMLRYIYIQLYIFMIFDVICTHKTLFLCEFEWI